MGEEQRPWAKLWCSADDDDDLDQLPIADYGRWCKLLTYVRRHGTNGSVILTRPARTLCARFQLGGPVDKLWKSCGKAVENSRWIAFLQVLGRLPGVDMQLLGQGGIKTSKVRVTFRKWNIYQDDGGAMRTRAWRERQKSVTDQIREEKIRSSPLPPVPEPRPRKPRKEKPEQLAKRVRELEDQVDQVTTAEDRDRLSALLQTARENLALSKGGIKW